MSEPEPSQNSWLPTQVAIIQDPAQARSLLDPLRRSILEALQEPGSSSSVADELGLPRQRLNYHVRSLESEGLLVHIEDRRKGNCVERILRATAGRFILDPELLGALRPGGTSVSKHRFSSSPQDLLVAAGRTLNEVGVLLETNPDETARLPTLSFETDVRFRSPAEEVAFASAIRDILDQMTASYDDPAATNGRTFRITFGGHLRPNTPS